MYTSRSDQRSHDRRLVKGNQRPSFQERTPKGGRTDENSDLSMTVFAVETLGRADKAICLPMYPLALSCPTLGAFCPPLGGNISDASPHEYPYTA